MPDTFPNPVELSPRADGKTWRVGRRFFMWSKVAGFRQGFRVVVPEGFITDLASIPRVFWCLLPPFGKYTEAAVVHDFLYSAHLLSRRTADAVLLEGMTACGTPRWQRLAIWGAVRLCGWMFWGKQRSKYLCHSTNTKT